MKKFLAVFIAATLAIAVSIAIAEVQHEGYESPIDMSRGVSQNLHNLEVIRYLASGSAPTSPTDCRESQPINGISLESAMEHLEEIVTCERGEYIENGETVYYETTSPVAVLQDRLVVIMLKEIQFLEARRIQMKGRIDALVIRIEDLEAQMSQ